MELLSFSLWRCCYLLNLCMCMLTSPLGAPGQDPACLFGRVWAPEPSRTPSLDSGPTQPHGTSPLPSTYTDPISTQGAFQAPGAHEPGDTFPQNENHSPWAPTHPSQAFSLALPSAPSPLPSTSSYHPPQKTFPGHWWLLRPSVAQSGFMRPALSYC